MEENKKVKKLAPAVSENVCRQFSNQVKSIFDQICGGEMWGDSVPFYWLPKITLV